MARFTEILAGAAEVSCIQRVAPSLSECRIDSPVYVYTSLAWSAISSANQVRVLLDNLTRTGVEAGE